MSIDTLLVPNVTLPNLSASPSFACFVTPVVSVLTTLYSMVMPLSGSVSCVRMFVTLRRISISRKSSAIQALVLPVSPVAIRSRHSCMSCTAASSPRESACR